MALADYLPRKGFFDRLFNNQASAAPQSTPEGLEEAIKSSQVSWEKVGDSYQFTVRMDQQSTDLGPYDPRRKIIDDVMHQAGNLYLQTKDFGFNERLRSNNPTFRALKFSDLDRFLEINAPTYRELSANNNQYELTFIAQGPDDFITQVAGYVNMIGHEVENIPVKPYTPKRPIYTQGESNIIPGVSGDRRSFATPMKDRIGPPSNGYALQH